MFRHHLTIFALLLATLMTAACGDNLGPDPVLVLDQPALLAPQADEPAPRPLTARERAAALGRHQEAAGAPQAGEERPGQAVSAERPLPPLIEAPVICEHYDVLLLESAMVAAGETADVVVVISMADRPAVVAHDWPLERVSDPFTVQATREPVQLEAGASVALMTASLPQGWSTDADVLPRMIVPTPWGASTLTPTPWPWDSRRAYTSICD